MQELFKKQFVENAGLSELLDFWSYVYIRVTDIPDSLLKLFN